MSPLFFVPPLRLKFRLQQEPEPKFSAGMRVAEIFGQVHSSTMALSEILDLSGNFGPSEIFGRPHEPAYFKKSPVLLGSCDQVRINTRKVRLTILPCPTH